MQKFLNASTWNGFLGQPYPDAANLTTNAAIQTYLRRFSNTIKHPVGTASVSNNSTSSTGVVGPSLLVKQATGLRIVDASVIVSNSFRSLSLLQPRAVTGFPTARVYLIAERASALIKAQYGL